jgi:hypothetical protein
MQKSLNLRVYTCRTGGVSQGTSPVLYNQMKGGI